MGVRAFSIGLMLTEWLCLSCFYQVVQAATSQHVHDIESDIFANLYLIPNSELPRIKAYLVFNQGESHNPGTEGLAHYVEHLAFLNAVGDGSIPRHSNAWTNLHSTGYWLEFSEADQQQNLQTLLNVVTPLKLNERFMLEERNIIQREYDEALANYPYMLIEQSMRSTLFQDSGLARSVIGERETISNFDLQEAKELHKRSHQLSKATLLVSGDVTEEQLKQWLSVLAIPANNASPSQQSLNNNPEQVTGTAAEDIASSSVPSTVYMYEKHIPVDNCDNPAQCDATLHLLNRVVDSSLPGGVAPALRFDNFIASSFSFNLFQLGRKAAIVRFHARPDLNVDIDTLEAAYLDAWAATLDSEKGVKKTSVERVRKRELQWLDNIPDMPEHAMNLALQLLQDGRTVYTPEQYREAIVSVSYEDVMNLLARFHHEDGAVAIRRVLKESK